MYTAGMGTQSTFKLVGLAAVLATMAAMGSLLGENLRSGLVLPATAVRLGAD